MADLKNLSVEEFAAVTASDAPAPGGGSVSALAGSLGAALAEMVANLTVGKAKYAEVEDEMKEQKRTDRRHPERYRILHTLYERTWHAEGYRRAESSKKRSNAERP